MDIQVLDLAFIDRFSHHLFGLKGRTKADGVRGSQIMVYTGSGFGAADDSHLKGDTILMKACGPLGESPGDGHRRPRRSKAADAERRAVRDQFGGLFRGSQWKFLMTSHGFLPAAGLFAVQFTSLETRGPASQRKL